MIRLSASADSIKVLSTDAGNLHVTATISAVDGATVTPSTYGATTSYATETEIVAGPSSGRKDVTKIVIANAGTAFPRVRVKQIINSVTTVLATVIVPPGYALVQDPGGTWSVVPSPDYTSEGILTRTEFETELAADALLVVNNLSDLNSASAARTSLGLGTAATAASTSFATSAQGTKADAAIAGPGTVTDTRPVLFSGTTGKVVAQASAALGTAAFTAATAYATAAQGATADTAIQGPGTVVDGRPVLFSGTTGKAVAQGSALGTAAYLNAGTGVNNLVQLITGPKLPVLDGSNLTNVVAAGGLAAANNLSDLTNTTTARSNLGLGTAATTAASAYATAAQGAKADTATQPTDTYNVGLSFVIGATGIPLTTGIKGYVEIPFACTITAARLFADVSGSVVVDVFRCTYSAFDPATHPASADKLTASAPPTISTAKKSEDTTLTGWTKTLVAGDILAFNVNSVTTIAQVTIGLTLSRTQA